jgi:plastocyanin
MSSKASTAVGAIVSVLIIGAVATIGYYQVVIAPGVFSNSTTTTTSQGVNCTATPSACVKVTIVSGAASPYPGYTTESTTLYGYSPLTIKVVIGVNNTVVWTNNDTAFHTATGAPVFDSGCLNGNGAACPTSSAGRTFQFTFTTPGTFVYHCIYHPWMHGKVIVLASHP